MLINLELQQHSTTYSHISITTKKNNYVLTYSLIYITDKYFKYLVRQKGVKYVTPLQGVFGLCQTSNIIKAVKSGLGLYHKWSVKDIQTEFC
jgi:hypothetical protein